MRGWSRLAIVALVLAFPVSGNAQEGEWTQWGGPNGDFSAASTSLAEQWPEGGPPELWSRPLGAGHTAILVAEGRLYTMYRESHGEGGGSPWSPREAVVALDASTGETADGPEAARGVAGAGVEGGERRTKHEKKKK